jgi:hypothetical protein
MAVSMPWQTISMGYVWLGLPLSLLVIIFTPKYYVIVSLPILTVSVEDTGKLAAVHK